MRLFLCLWIFAGSLVARDYVALSTPPGAAAPEVTGKREWLDREMPPASTFKILLAWAILEEGRIRPEEKILSADAAGGPRGLTLQEAMRTSSNAYFESAVLRMDRTELKARLQKSGWFPTVPDWPNGRILSLVSDGPLRITPAHLHRMTRELAEGRLGSSERVRSELRQSMEWPGRGVHGKTGTFGGAAWMTGYKVHPGGVHVVTVLVPYQVPDWKPARIMAVSEFYRILGEPFPDGI
jgi:beta-lactamase class D